LAWAKKAQVDCDEEHAWLVQCHDVAPAVLGRRAAEPRVEEMSFGFRPDGRLVNVSTFRRRLGPAQATGMVEEIARGLDTALAVPTDRVGEGKLSEAPLSSLRVSFRYNDHLAEVTAVNLPTTGIAVREQYVSAKD
jgi:hypothetical protein